MNRENIYKSLFELVGSVADFQFKSRRLKVWSDVSPSDMPALFMLQNNEVPETTRNMPTKWTFRPEFYIYVSVGNEIDANPYEILNPILDKVTSLFHPKYLQDVITLDGLVHSAKINGAIEVDGGILGTVAVAIIPVEIIVTEQ